MNDLHKPNNWILSSFGLVAGKNLLGQETDCWKGTFTCQECHKKYIRFFYDNPRDLEVDKTTWEWGWSQNP